MLAFDPRPLYVPARGCAMLLKFVQLPNVSLPSLVQGHERCGVDLRPLEKLPLFPPP